MAQRQAAGQIVQGNQGSTKLDASGNIYTSNFGGRIMKVDPTGADARDVVDISAVSCPTGQAGNDQPGFRGFTFSPDGDLVVTGYCLDNVYIFNQADINTAYSTSTPITTLPTPFIANPSNALDGPYLNGPFGLAFYTSTVPTLWEGHDTEGAEQRRQRRRERPRRDPGRQPRRSLSDHPGRGGQRKPRQHHQGSTWHL